MYHVYNQILELIQQYENICIYRHQKPDGDAVGSQLAFKTWMQDNYPNKLVYLMGIDKYEKLPYVDVISDEITKKCLAIILDTANGGRVDDSRFTLADKSIKLDHHSFNDDYATINVVDPKYAATCELLTDLFIYFEEEYQLKLSKETARYLYIGILTDTMSFKTSNVSANTLKVASKLVDKGIQVSEICKFVLTKSYSQFKIANHVRNKIILEDRLAYAIFSYQQSLELNTDTATIRNQISELFGIDEFQIWLIVTQIESGEYKASIRSKQMAINHIAEKYGGGGHQLAAGASPKNIEEVFNLIKDLKNICI